MKSYDFSRYYFLDLLMVTLAIVALVASIYHRRKLRLASLLSCYLSCFLLLCAVCLYDDLSGQKGALVNRGNNGFLILELSVFSIYLQKNIQSPPIRRILFLTVPFIVVFIITQWIIHPGSFGDDITTPFVLGSGFMIFPCLFYYLELMNVSSPAALGNIPSFWVVTGILLYNSCCIPVLLFENHVNQELKDQFEILFSRNYLSYCMLFLLFTRAFLCKKHQTA